MGHDVDRDTADKAPEAREDAALNAYERLAADARGSTQTKIADSDLPKYSVDRDKVGTDDNYTLYTQYPNGVRMERQFGGGLNNDKFSGSFEPPPGGSQVHIKDGWEMRWTKDGQEVKVRHAEKGIPDGTEIARDASGKEVARLDPDATLHVHTKHGEYTETQKGQVTFTSKDGTTDWQSLRKDGQVARDKLEDYGVSGAGNDTRFPNGIVWNRATHTATFPSEAGNMPRQEKVSDANGGVYKGYDSNGKVLYTLDAKGFHVTTPDGELTQTDDGRVTFKANKTAVAASRAALPDVEVTERR